MKKAFLLLALTQMSAVAALAGTIAIGGVPTESVSGFAEAGSEIEVKDIVFTNTSSTTKDFKAIRTDNTLTTGQESYFCWGLCYGVNTNESLPMTIAGNDLDKTFSLHLKTKGIVGTASITISIVDAADVDDATSFTITFDATTGIYTFDLAPATLGVPYPVPAKEVLFATYDASATRQTASVELYTLSGAKVWSQPISGTGTLRMERGTLPAGTYILRLLLDEKMLMTRRIILE